MAVLAFLRSCAHFKSFSEEKIVTLWNSEKIALAQLLKKAQTAMFV